MFEHDWQREWFFKHGRAQYGFCPWGHYRSVRTIRDENGRYLRVQVFCPTCEH